MTCGICGREHTCPFTEECHIPIEEHDRFDRCNTFDPDGHP